jgi:hypothetical protein
MLKLCWFSLYITALEIYDMFSVMWETLREQNVRTELTKLAGVIY